MLLANTSLLIICFLLAGLFMGWLLHRSDFCISGILRDAFLFRSYALLPSLLLVVVAGLIVFQLARAAGVIPADLPPTYSSDISLTVFAGGLLFGVGMVLAGGCVVGTLYKLGSGNLTSLIAFIGMMAGSMLYAEIHPLVNGLHDLTLVTGNTTLLQTPASLGGSIPWVLIALGSLPLLIWQRQGKIRVDTVIDGYIQPWRVALILAALNLLIYILGGWPMAVSTAYTKIAAFLELLVAPGHVAQLAFFQQDSRVVETVVGELSGGPGPRVDLIFITDLPLLVGVILGALASALMLGTLRLHGWPSLRQGFTAFGGGILVLLGARIAGGCNLTFILGGLPLLSLQAILFTFGLLVGAWLGSLMLSRIIFR